MERIPALVRPNALARIEWHLEQHHTVVVISASMDIWLKSWCEKKKIELIATHLEVKEGVVTGRLASSNCYGPEKVNRIKSEIELASYPYIYAYGDSRGDAEMLAIAHEKYYRHF